MSLARDICVPRGRWMIPVRIPTVEEIQKKLQISVGDSKCKAEETVKPFPIETASKNF